MSEQASRRQSDKALSTPNAMGNVWPKQSCPVFVPRAGQNPDVNQCWYCIHADFHLDKPHSLEVGVCYWPKPQRRP